MQAWSPVKSIRQTNNASYSPFHSYNISGDEEYSKGDNKVKICLKIAYF